MTEREKEEFINNFDVVSILDNLEENNKLVVKFLLRGDSEDLPLEIFDILYREILFLKKACEKNENWNKLIDVYMRNINSVRNNEKFFYYLLNGTLKKISLSDKVKEFLENEISICLSQDIEKL